MLNETMYPDPETGLNREYKVQGVETAQVMLKVMAARHYSDVLCAISKISREIMQAPIAGTTEWSYTPGCACTDRVEPRFKTGKDVPQHSVRLHVIKIGELALYGVTGELYSSFEPVIRGASPVKDTIIITHDASDMANCHYILDDGIISRSEAPNGRQDLPGYWEFRNLSGYMRDRRIYNLSGRPGIGGYLNPGSHRGQFGLS